jgi:hypothetical protein
MGCNTGFWQSVGAARSRTSSTGHQIVDEPRKRRYEQRLRNNDGFSVGAARSRTSSTDHKIVDEPRKRRYEQRLPSSSPIGPVRSIDCRVPLRNSYFAKDICSR